MDKTPFKILKIFAKPSDSLVVILHCSYDNCVFMCRRLCKSFSLSRFVVVTVSYPLTVKIF